MWFIGASSLVNGRSVLIALRPLSHDCLRFLVQNCVINEKLDLVGKFELSLRTRSQMAALQNPPALTQKDPGNDYLESVFLTFLMITSMERREILKIHEVIIGNCLKRNPFSTGFDCENGNLTTPSCPLEPFGMDARRKEFYLNDNRNFFNGTSGECFIGRKVIRNYWPASYGHSIYPLLTKKPFKLT